MEAREEILMILKMVQDGKITNEDAAKLIEAIEGKKTTGSSGYERRDKKKSGSRTSFEEKMENMAEGLENMVSDVVDSTEKAFRNFPDINFGNWFSQVEKRHFTYKASEGMKLDIATKNGSVRVYPSDNDKINAVFSISVKRDMDIDEVMERIAIQHNDDLLAVEASGVDGGVSIELRIPLIKYSSVKFKTRNGSLRCGPITADELELLTKNGSLKVEGAKSPTVKASTKNGSVTFQDCEAEKVGLNTTNGSINVYDSKCTLLDLNTTNGSIKCISSKSDNIDANTSNASIRMENFSPRGQNGIMNLKTSNGNIRIELPSDTGVKFNAHAGRHGKVIVNHPCTINKEMEYAGQTEGYESAEKKMNVTARTNLGRIEIS
ncbi:MAG: DUF4097 family beta strand repeat-containing protein [Clostridia bacterium]|nr:DUF4097 family beta strand repeat-containing protein [Clostridia bacterium]